MNPMDGMWRFLSRFSRRPPELKVAALEDLEVCVELAYQAAMEAVPEQVSSGTVHRLSAHYHQLLTNERGIVLLAVPDDERDTLPAGIIHALLWGNNMLDGRLQAQAAGMYVRPEYRQDPRYVTVLIKAAIAWMQGNEVELLIATIDPDDREHIGRMVRLLGLTEEGRQRTYTLPLKGDR